MGSEEILVMNPRKKRRNPRGVRYSGCIAFRKTKSGRRLRLIRARAGRRRRAFIPAWALPRGIKSALLRACRRAKYGRGCSALKRSVTKGGKCRRIGRRR